jgi:putative tryptophan/tyrosine transport system substrate-binding protein
MRFGHLKRRELMTLLGGAAAWPLVARAQQDGRNRRIGVLMPYLNRDALGQARLAAFTEELQRLGWTDGRNLQIAVRWAERSISLLAAELVALAPDVLLGTGIPSVTALQLETRSIPIVFVQLADPVGAGIVQSLARPGGNVTGFLQFDYTVSGKWLELLKQVAPGVTRAAVLRNPAIASGIQFAGIQSVAPSLGVEVSAINISAAAEIERDVTAFARSTNVGLIVTEPLVVLYSDVILSLAARHGLPAIYPFRSIVAGGGLMSYGPNLIDPYRRAAGYVDRILRGEKPADLPVQAPTKYDLAINLKTAKALGLEVPPTLLGRADEVIE